VNAKSHSGVHIGIFKLFFFGEEATEELAEEAHDNGLCLVKGMCVDVSGVGVIDVVDWSLKQLWAGSAACWKVREVQVGLMFLMLLMGRGNNFSHNMPFGV
jgi:hypothetical protein